MLAKKLAFFEIKTKLNYAKIVIITLTPASLIRTIQLLAFIFHASRRNKPALKDSLFEALEGTRYGKLGSKLGRNFFIKD
jgi:hypothetical protein